jgi:non-ribosomal peptide synthetase component F
MERGPLVAACLLRLADDDHIVTLTIHHILADGASLAILDRELAAYYRAFVAGAEPDLPELPVQYGDFAVWYATTSQPQQQEDFNYWVNRLAGAPALELRTDLPRPPRKGAPADDVRHLIDGEVAARAAELARAHRSTRVMVLLATLQTVLWRHSGQADFCVGLPVAGTWRTRPELAPLVGSFATMLPLRCQLSGDPTFTEVLAAARDSLLDALDHQDIAFSRLTSALGVPHDPGRTQLCQVLFDFDEHFESTELDLPGLRVDGFPLGLPKIPYDLMVYGWLGQDGLWLRLIYDTALWQPTTIAELARDYEKVLRVAVDAPHTRISALFG